MENIKHPTESKKKNYTPTKSKSTSSKISDREIQEKILANLRDISSSNSYIKGWVTFFGVLLILGIIVVLVTLK